MEGIGRVLPKGNKIMLPSLTKIYVGDPVDINGMNAQQITEVIEKRVLDLKDKSASNKPSFNS